MSSYEDPGCAYCPSTVRACRDGEGETRGPGFCPSKIEPGVIEGAVARLDDPELLRVARVSAEVEGEGYCQWTRVEEICEFAKRMGYRKVGIASCISFLDVAHTLSGVLESHGFEVASICCKNGSVPKEDIGLDDAQKIRPGTFEPMCNPIAQAEFLNSVGAEFNVVLGLCIGHDSLFFKHSDALATTLVAKDRVLAHNPVGALHLADSYFRRIWGPERREEPRRKPARTPAQASAAANRSRT